MAIGNNDSLFAGSQWSVAELNFTFLIVSFFFVKSAVPPCRAEPKASLLPSACFSHEDSVKLSEEASTCAQRRAAPTKKSVTHFCACATGTLRVN
jgi:hypothetical protein